MSTKAALILGDYSNGWSDSIQVQVVMKIDNIKTFANDRDFVSSVMSRHLNQAVAELEGSETINPRPLDEPCCDEFKGWAKDLEKECSAKFCPFCNTKITDQRRKKYVGNLVY